MMLQLHYCPGTASMTPHILLQEIDVPFELVLVDRMADAHKAPDYLKLNPNGLSWPATVVPGCWGSIIRRSIRMP